MRTMTMGDAIRRLELHPYVVICHQTGERYRVRDMREAMQAAKMMAARMPGHSIHIHLPSGAPRFDRRSLVAAIVKTARGYNVRFNTALRGLGDPLTDWACSQQEFVSNWRDRVNAGINTGTQAAVLASAAAGAIGALVDRPLIGAVIGAVVGWGTHAIWTAPQRVS